MAQNSSREKNRRSFLKYLAASPVLAAGAKSALAATGTELQTRPEDPYQWWPRDPNFVVDKPEDALDVFELEAVARQKVPIAHFAYMSSNADGDGGAIRDRQDIMKFALRPRRLRDVRKVDASIDIFGAKYNWPFFFCPVGGPSAQNEVGNIGAARAAGRHNVAQMVGSSPTADVNKARNGTSTFFQMYINPNFEVSKNMLQNAEKAGARVVGVTIDLPSARKMTQFERTKFKDTRICGTCHQIADPKYPKGTVERRVGSTGSNASGASEAMTPEAKAYKGPPAIMTWETIKRLRDVTKMDIMIKGIMHPADAEMCVKLGYGVFVSNHGGRNEDTGASSIGALPDILKVAKGKVPVFVDGGFRRGMDIVKALSMGADMVGFGRPWLWGLGSFGEEGVDRVIAIITAEIVAAMQQVGAASLKDLTPNLVVRAL